MTRSASSLRIATLCLAALIAWAHPAAAQLAADVKGGVDHPAVSRYAGSVMIGHLTQAFGELVVPLGEVHYVGSELRAAKSERLEGALTRLLYIAPEKRTPFEVMRNYELELAKGGFKTVWTCTAPPAAGARG